LLRVLVRSACRLVIATKVAMGAADPAKGPRAMTNDHDDTELEPPHDSSPTDHLLNELQLYGHRPFQDEPDPRPLPEGKAIACAIADIFDALVATLSDTHGPTSAPKPQPATPASAQCCRQSGTLPFLMQEKSGADP
jgi:hypothetical protein